MTFEEWFKQEPMPESYHNMAKAFYLLNKELSKLAWDYQQEIIDDLKEQLENERRRADEYFDKWDNLMKESEFEKL